MGFSTFISQWWKNNQDHMNDAEDAAQCAWDEARLVEATGRTGDGGPVWVDLPDSMGFWWIEKEDGTK